MNTLQERVANFLEIRKLSQAEAARRGGFKNAAFINDILRGHKAGVRGENLERLAKALSTTDAFLLGRTEDADPVPSLKAGEYKPPPILIGVGPDMSVFQSAEGGRGSIIISTEPIDRVQRPYVLKNVPEAYAIVIEGDSMDPAYRPGDIAWVNPRLGPRREQDVILYTPEQDRAMIKHVLGHNEFEWTLQQYNPRKSFVVNKEDWPICHRVVGKLHRP